MGDPMASVPRRRLDAFLAEAVAPFLRKLGFVRSGRSWRRVRGDAIQVLAVEGDRWNRGDVCRFCCVGAAWYPAVARRLREPKTMRPTWWAGHLRWSEPGMHDLGPDTDRENLARSVLAELTRVLRWLDARTLVDRAWRAMPKPPRYPPPLAVQNALRELGGRKPLPKPKPARSRQPQRKLAFQVRSIVAETARTTP